MQFNRVLLISPPAESRYGGLRIPAGVGYIAQALYERGIEYDYVDMRIGYSYNDLEKKAVKFRPDLIGFSASSLGYRNTYRIIESLKRRVPKAAVVVGGHHMTILRHRVMEECGAIDYGVVSDGERTIVELCEGSRPDEGIQGLLYRNHAETGPERIAYTGKRAPDNLDEIAYPRYIRFKMDDYSRQMPVHSSRGCVHHCTFCPNKLIGGAYRTRSVKHFVDEIEYWYEKGIRQFAIDDDNFALLKSRVYQICDAIERRGLKDLFIRCSNGLRADSVDRPLLARMKAVGVKEVGFGIDGGNNRMLHHLKKGETIETIERAVSAACELGLDVRLFFMIGTPHETRDDIEDSIRLARKYQVVKVNLNNPIPYPGTEMYDYLEKNGLFTVPPDEYLNSVAENEGSPVFATPELSVTERVEILKRCRVVETEITGKSVMRLFGNFSFMRFALNYSLISYFEKLFFNNLLFRKLFERLRYKKLIRH